MSLECGDRASKNMDRSFLSNAQVVEASRDFVCLRLATYEDAKEAEYLRKVYGRGGDLENTVFAILDPDGNKLTRASRGPRYRSPSQMAASMKKLVRDDYRDASKLRWSDPTLPEMKSLDLAMNVASCDSVPMVLAIGTDAKDVERLRKQLLPFAWHEDLAGQFAFATATADSDLRAVTGLPDGDNRGVYVLEPDAFGVVANVSAKVSMEDATMTETDLTKALAKFEPLQKDHRQHVRSGYLMGLKWETAVPVTDRMGAAAAKRLWGE